MTGPVWVVAESEPGGIRDCTLEALDEGRRLAVSLGAKLCAAVLGAAIPADWVSRLGRQDVDEVYRIEHPLLERYSTDGYLRALEQALGERPPGLVLLSATPDGQDLGPRLAVRLRARLFTNCTSARATARGELRFVRPTHADKIYTTYTCAAGRPVVATLRPGVIGWDEPHLRPRTPEVIRLVPDLSPRDIRTRFLEFLPGDPRQVDLSTAERVVGGGKGAEDEAGWRLIEAAADALGAALGGSRAAADQGWIPRHRMIGQTGRSIRPRLYLAAGISGVTHHLGGVRAENLVAINTDRSAPIFQAADLGIAGDLREILPILVRRLEEIHRMKEQDAG